MSFLKLQTDGRLTNAELAQRVGLSAAPCWRRVRALEAGGFITGYRAELNRRMIGLGVMAFVRLDAERTTGDGTRLPEEAIRRLPLGHLGPRAGDARQRRIGPGTGWRRRHFGHRTHSRRGCLSRPAMSPACGPQPTK